MYAHGSSSPRLGSWYNSWDDFWGDVQSIATKAPQVVRTGQTVVTNLPNIAQPSITVNTLLYAALGVGAMMMLARRSNPPRHARRRRRQR